MTDSFYSLSPDKVLNCVEASLQKNFPHARVTGKAFALNSLENRVFEIELEDKIMGEQSIVSKFYRPGRWSKAQILEEHRFIRELKEAEVPAVAAITDLETTEEGIFFISFPKIRGRLKDELQGEELRQLGRLLARLHSVGSRFESKHRLKLDLETYGNKSLHTLLNTDFMDENIKIRYKSICENLFARIHNFASIPTQSIHGDCHVGNILWNEQGPFFLDFDDMLIGPPVQDVWMIIKGRDQVDFEMREELLGGYDLMNEFDRSTLSWVEPLRALRMIHYSAWIARRWNDPSFPNMFTHFGTQQYWYEEIQALDEVLSLIY